MSETSPKKGSCLLKGMFVLALLALVAGGLWWWMNRPIEPVVLSAQEMRVAEEKVEALQAPEPAELATAEYQAGTREIVLSEKELNGLLNQHTSLGNQLQFELAQDALHARVEMDLDPGLPIVGGRRLKARARCLLQQDDAGVHLVVEDVTVWGVSLPNDWLGGIKGRDLIGELLGEESSGGLAGVKSIHVEPGQIRIELKE